MTESQPLASKTSEAAKARYRCWETILTEKGDESLQKIDDILAQHLHGCVTFRSPLPARNA